MSIERRITLVVFVLLINTPIAISTIPSPHYTGEIFYCSTANSTVPMIDCTSSSNGWATAISSLDSNEDLGEEITACSDLGFSDMSRAIPVLSEGRVAPSEGDYGTLFAYIVNYTDPDNDTPVCASVVIDGEIFGMVTFDADYSRGAVFVYYTTLKGDQHDYYFKFSDGSGWVRLPDSGVFEGPRVEVPVKPTISNGMVIPSNGTTDTLFHYTVRYNDSNGDPPVTCRVIIDGTGHDMDTNGTDYIGGCEYTYETRLTQRSHNYSFLFADNTGNVALPESGSYPGPEVKAANSPPVLSNGSVTPENGSHAGLFTFSVDYRDPDGDAADYVRVDVRPASNGGRGPEENWTGGGDLPMVSTDGTHFTCSTRLSPGTWSFRFSATDGRFGIQFPAGFLPGPISENGAPMALIREGYGPFSIREGTALELNANGSIDPDLDALAFRWSLDEGSESFVGSRVFFIPSLGEHNLTLNVTDPYGLVDQVTVKLYVLHPDAWFSVTSPGPDLSKVKEGQRVNWSVNITNEGDAFSGTTNITWMLDGTEVATSPVPSIGPGKMASARWSWKATAGSHTVTVKIGRIENTSQLDVATNRPPSAAIDIPGKITVKSTVVFGAANSTDQDGTLVSYLWDFGDGGKAEGSRANHVFSRSGTYNVNLTVIDNNGASGVASVNVTVRPLVSPEPKKFIPGANIFIFGVAVAISALLRGKRCKKRSKTDFARG